MSGTSKEVDAYIAGFAAETQTVLQQIRARVHGVVPEATETISYRLPTFKLGGKVLVHFGGFQHHVSMYPVPPTDDTALTAEIEKHQVSKGTLKFPLDEPIPYDFIERIALAHRARLEHD